MVQDRVTHRRKVGTHGQVKGRQRSGNFGRDRRILGKMGRSIGRVPRNLIFLCGNPDDFSATSQLPIFTKFGGFWPRNVNPCLTEECRKTFSKIFTLGVICPQKTSKLKGVYSIAFSFNTMLRCCTCKTRLCSLAEVTTL